MSQTPNIAEQLLAQPSIAKLSRDQRDSLLDSMVTEAHDNPQFNRGELESLRERSMRLKYDMANIKGDFDYSNIPSQKFFEWDEAISYSPEETFMQKEEWESYTPEKKYNLYKTYIDTYGSDSLSMLGHRLKDIGVAATTADTYTKMGRVTADAIKGFVANLPEYQTRAAISQAESDMVASGEIDENQLSSIKAQSEIIIKESEERANVVWKDITQEAFDEWDSYRATNPYGVDFVKNRVIDVAVGIPFGIYGAGIRSGLGATAMEIGRASVAPVISSAAQGVAFEWAFDSIDQALQDSDVWKGASGSEKLSLRVFALGVSLIASVPVDTRLQNLIKGRTGSEIVQTGIKAVEGNQQLMNSINELIASAEKDGVDIVSAIAASPNIVKNLQETFIKSGMAPADFQLNSVVEALNTASRRLDEIKAGVSSEYSPVDEVISDNIKVYSTGPDPVAEQARSAVDKDASSRITAIEKIETQIPHLEQEAARAKVQGNVEVALAKDAEISELREEVLRNVVVDDASKKRTADIIYKEIKATTDKEVRRSLLAEWANAATPMERAKALSKYDMAEEAVIKQLEELGVAVDIPTMPGRSNYLSPYPLGKGTPNSAGYIPPWKYTIVNKLSDTDKKLVEDLIRRHHDLTYDRAPIRNFKAYREAAGEGGYLPGQKGPRPEFEADKAIKDAENIDTLKNVTSDVEKDVSNLQKSDIKELDLPTSDELAPITDDANIVDQIATPIPGEVTVSAALKERWEKKLGRVLSVEEVVAANKRARMLLEKTIKEAQDAPIFSYLDTGETVFSAEALERRFPVLKGAFVNAMDALVGNRVLWKDGLVTQEAVLQYMKNIWKSVNLNNMPGWYEKMRPMIEAADQMWDYVRSVSQQAPKKDAIDNFFTVLKQQVKGTQLTARNIDAARTQIERLFPNFDASISFDPKMKGAGKFDEIARDIILNPEKLNPRTLMHELGHYYYTHVLTSGERMAFLDTIRPAINNANVFSDMFPEIAESIAKADYLAGELGSRGAQYVAYRLDPSELFADTWINFLGNGRVPTMSTLGTLDSLFRGMKGFSEQSKTSFEKLPEPLKKLLSKLSLGPTPGQLSRMLDDTRKALKDATVSRFVANGDIEGRVDELYNLLSIKYGGVEIAGGDIAANLTPNSRSKIFSVQKQADSEKLLANSVEQSIDMEEYIPAFWSLSPEEQVALLARDTEDLLQYAEMQSLKMLNGDLSALDYAEAAYRSLDQQFGSMQVAERNLKNMQAATDRFLLHQEKFEWDYKIGEEIEQSAAFSESRMSAERWEFSRYQEHAIRANEYANQKVAEAIQERALEAKLRNNQTTLSGQKMAWELEDLRESMQGLSGQRLRAVQQKADELEKALNNLRSRWKEGAGKEPEYKPIPLTQDEVRKIRAEAYKEFNADIEISNVVEIAAKLADQKVPNMSIPGAKSAWEKEFMRQCSFLNKGLSGNEMVTTDIRLNEAARLGEYVMLKQLHNHAKVEAGLVDFADSSWFTRQEAAQHLIDQWQDTSVKGQVLRQIFSKPISKSVRYLGATTLGWEQDEEGSWIFNPTLAAQRVASAPWLAWLFPGGRFFTQQLAKGGKGLGAAVMKRQSLKTQEAASELWSNLKFNWFEYRGDKQLELMKRAAIRTAGNIKREATDLGGQLNLMFPVTGKDKDLIKINKAIRSDIMKVVENTVEGKEIAARWAKEDPSMLDIADKVYSFYRKQTEFLIKRGAILDTDATYVNRVYESTSAMTLNDIRIQNKTLRGLKLPHMQESGVSFDIAPYGSPGKVIVDGQETEALFAEESLANLIADSRNSGDPLVVGDRINVYKKPNSPILYVARDGSALANKYDELFEPYAVWNSVGNEKGFTVNKIGRYTSNNTPKVSIKRPFTATEEEMMGRSYDAALKAASFGERLEKDLAKADIYSRLAENATKNSDYAINVSSIKSHIEIDGQLMRRDDAIALLKKRGWKELDYSKTKEGAFKYGALRAHYVSPDTYKMLRTFEQGSTISDLRNTYPAVDRYIKTIQFFKRNKTILNLPTHVVNFISNGMQGLLYGRNPLNDLWHGAGMMHARQLEDKYRKARIAMNGSKETEDAMNAAYKALVEHPYFDALRDARIAKIGDSSLVTSEFSYSELHKMLNEMQDTDTMGSLAKLHDITLGRMARGWAKTNEFMRHLYEGEDLIYKLGGLYNDIKAGKTIDESLDSIYGAYFDYGNLPPGPAAVRDAGLVPFVSYMYKALPGMLKGIYEKPERLAGVLLAVEGFNLMMAANDYGMSDAKEARQIQQQIFNDRRKRYVWGIPSQLYLGGAYEKDVDDNDKWVSKYLDIGKYIPGAGPVESLGYDNIGTKAPGEIASFVLGSNPLLNILYTVAANKDPGLNMPVEGIEEHAKHVWRTMVPNWPGLGPTRATELLQDSLVDMGISSPSEKHTGFTRQGIAKSGTTSIAQAFLGINIARLDDNNEAQRRILEQRYALDKLVNKAKSSLREPGLPMSDSQKIRIKLQEDISEVMPKVQKAQTAMQRYQELRARYQTTRGGTGLPQP